MKALAFKRFGGPDQAAFADILRPVPHPDEILVRVHAAGLNPVDHKIRDGQMKQMKAILRFQLPATQIADRPWSIRSGTSKRPAAEPAARSHAVEYTLAESLRVTLV